MLKCVISHGCMGTPSSYSTTPFVFPVLFKPSNSFSVWSSYFYVLRYLIAISQSLNLAKLSWYNPFNWSYSLHLKLLSTRLYRCGQRTWLIKEEKSHGLFNTINYLLNTLRLWALLWPVRKGDPDKLRLKRDLGEWRANWELKTVKWNRLSSVEW